MHIPAAPRTRATTRDTPATPEDAQRSFELQASLLKTLIALPVADVAGVSLSLLLHYAHEHPDVLRRLLNEPVVKEGFRGISMLTVLTRAARS